MEQREGLLRLAQAIEEQAKAIRQQAATLGKMAQIDKSGETR
jgi:hypothetical protein